MLARVYRNVGRGRETGLARKGSSPPALDAFLPAPIAIDRWSLRGPLAGLVTTMAQMRARWVFAVAGDAPLVAASFIETLASECRPGDEAIIPGHGARREEAPRAARRALRSAGVLARRRPRGARRRRRTAQGHRSPADAL